MNSFHFHIPNYVENSNGIKLLWEAAYQFSLHRKVTITSFFHGEKEFVIPSKCRELIVDNFQRNKSDILIYPDVVNGNPFEWKKVGRFLLAKEFILNGEPANVDSNDFLFAYSVAVDANLTQYHLLDPKILDIQKLATKKKKGKVVVYFGKCRLIKNPEFNTLLKKFDEVVIVTRLFPSDREKLFSEIAEAELLVSFDPLTNLCFEANLLGTPALLMDDVFRDCYESFNVKIEGFYYKEHISDIEQIILSSDGLRVNSNENVSKCLQQSSQMTLDLISSMEKHFKKTNSELLSSFDSFRDDSLEFYLKKWDASPIVNCTTINSVWGYKLLCRSVGLYMTFKVFKNMIQLPNLIYKKTKVFLYQISRAYYHKNFGYNERLCLFYKRNPEKFKSRIAGIYAKAEQLNLKKDSSCDVVRLNKFQKFFMGRV